MEMTLMRNRPAMLTLDQDMLIGGACARRRASGSRRAIRRPANCSPAWRGHGAGCRPRGGRRRAALKALGGG
jgi:hypothetical protein